MDIDKLNFLTAGMPLATGKGSYKEAFGIIKDLNLDGMELEFVHGVRMSQPTQKLVDEIRKTNNFILTAHAPFYINLNSKEEEKIEEPVEDKTSEHEAKIKELEEMLANKQAELDNKQNELDSKDAEVEQLKKQAEELANAPVNEPSEANLTLEEYEQRLETLTQRLKINEKQLKDVKKEYLPLARVKKSLEKDKKKLRRREALVAKQKVVLYGVNNIGDIDEEKAKKLAEDLDLLDGLKVSVEHCEEVLKENQERYPILENSYNILTENTNAIKADIAECQAKIDELKAKDSDSDSNKD